MNPKDVARTLLETRTIFFNFNKPYISYSGYYLPIYCDNRLILSYPKVRKKITSCFVKTIKKKFPGVQMIFGIAVAGVAFATLVSENMDLPMGYVLTEEKDHGLRNRVEGALREKCKVVVVDDVVCTGNTLVDVCECLRSAGCEVLGAVSVFSYEINDTIVKLKGKNIPFYSLTNFDVLMRIAFSKGRLGKEDLLKAEEFKENPTLASNDE